jgi:hypothetical protein
MPTYRATCAVCRHEKWPVLPERPSRYVCVLCGAIPAEQRGAVIAQRVAKGHHTARVNAQQRRRATQGPEPAR